MSNKTQHKRHDKVEWTATIGEILLFFPRIIVHFFRAIFN